MMPALDSLHHPRQRDQIWDSAHRVPAVMRTRFNPERDIVLRLFGKKTDGRQVAAATTPTAPPIPDGPPSRAGPTRPASGPFHCPLPGMTNERRARLLRPSRFSGPSNDRVRPSLTNGAAHLTPPEAPISHRARKRPDTRVPGRRVCKSAKPSCSCRHTAPAARQGPPD
jgi:hypothetical protein